MLAAVSLVLIFGTYSTFAQETGSSYSGGGENESCIVPIYSVPLYEVNATEENTALLLVNGRCFLTCLTTYSAFITSFNLYSAWPFAVLNDGISCTDNVAKIHECTRGCQSMLTDPQVTPRSLAMNRLDDIRCQETCMAECSRECGGASSCNNPDLIDLWVARTDCPIQCNERIPCQLGCRNARDIITGRPLIPLSPLAPPALTEWSDSSDDDRGLYRINLMSAAGRRISRTNYLNGFIFRIHDIGTDNVTYIWQHDVRNYLNLSSHICRTIQVSFSVVNQFGSTAYSDPVEIFIPEDRRQIPNPPIIRNIYETFDERTSFFQHVVINVTWETPQDDNHLANFVVTLMNAESSPSYCTRTNNRITSNLVEHTSQRQYSTLLKAISTADGPFMGCNYIITVISMGSDGNRSVSRQHQTTSLSNYLESLISFSCSKQFRYNHFENPYFQFFYEVTIAARNLAEGHFISRFLISRKLNVITTITGVPKLLDQEDGSMMSYDFQVGQTHYNIPDTIYSRFHRPRTDTLYTSHYFLFNLSLAWNIRAFIVPLPVNYFVCETPAVSDPPSSVVNFTLHSASAVGNNSILISATWSPPAEFNGIPSNYVVCLSREPLTGSENPTLDDHCEVLYKNQTSIVSEFHYDTLKSIIYLQIRPSNTHTLGNWSEFLEVNIPDQNIVTVIVTEPPITDVVRVIVPPSSATGLSRGEIAATVVILFIILVVTAAICTICITCFIAAMRRKKKLMKMTETVPNYTPMFTVNYAPKENPPLLEMDSVEVIASDEWEIAPTDITVDDKLGEGAFGEVYRGILKGPLANTRVKPEFRNAIHLPVAIKLLKDTAKGSERQDFLSEIEMMKKVSEGRNAHVVAMLGCVTIQEPLCLATEFVQFGDLLSYLRSSRAIYLSGSTTGQEDPYLKLGQLTPADLPSFSYQIAAGMAYLSSIGIVHRDLACRNVLVDADKALKITDFGMSRETEDVYVQKSKGRVPFKWMAIESIIAREYTSASDVWSFGITVWEIETIGGVPYPGVSNAELLPLLKRGHRMEKPDRCSDEIYNIMLSCWQENPNQRPPFHDLKSKFNNILASKGSDPYVDFCIDPNKTYYKTDTETDIPASRNFLHPSLSYKRRSKKVSPNGSFEGISVSIHKASPSPQASPRGKHLSVLASSTVSMEKDSCSQDQFKSLKGDGRPSSMMLFKPSQEQEQTKRKSGLDQDIRDAEDDRYVKEPSALLGVRNTMFENSTSGQKSESDERVHRSTSPFVNDFR